MATFRLDGAAVAQGVLGTNDGLNYGRFEHPVSPFMRATYRDILIAFAPYTAHSDFIISSTDAIRVDDSGIGIVGRCFARRSPRPL